jgi:hypothetical protein
MSLEEPLPLLAEDVSPERDLMPDLISKEPLGIYLFWNEWNHISFNFTKVPSKQDDTLRSINHKYGK